MYCSQCGAKNPGDAVYCRACGKSIRLNVTQLMPNDSQQPAAFAKQQQLSETPTSLSTLSDRRWPLVCQILMILSCCLSVASYYFAAQASLSLMRSTDFRAYLSAYVVHIPGFLLTVFYLLLFLLPTKKKPWLLFIPMAIGLLFSFVTICFTTSQRISDFQRMSDNTTWMTLANVLKIWISFLISISLSVLFLLGTVLKRKPLAIPLVYLILHAVSLIWSTIQLVGQTAILRSEKPTDYLQKYFNNSFYCSLFSLIGGILSAAVFCIALFHLRALAVRKASQIA